MEGRFTEEAAENRKRDFEAISTALALEGLDPRLKEAMTQYNIYHLLSGADLEESDLTALRNHLVASTAAVVRIEFLSERKAQQFMTYMRNSKYWKFPDQSDTRLRLGQDPCSRSTSFWIFWEN